MREIKFRGKSIETGEWVYGSLINNLFYSIGENTPIPYIVDPARFEEYDSFEDIERLAVQVDPETVGQYTGLKDKHKTMVYESDIYENPHGVRYLIKYDQKYCRYVGDAINRGYKECELVEPLRGIVIGNRFDNPNLL